MYLERNFGLLLSGNFGLRPKFPLSEKLREIPSLFG